MMNDRVDPPIDIQWVVTKNMNRFSVNRYVDPTDGLEFDEQDLSPLEKGHVYQWKPEGDLVAIHTPYRVVDLESAGLLAGLPSFRTRDPGISKTIPPITRRYPSTALQDFTLSKREFQLFQGAAQEKGWVLERDEVDLEALLNDTHQRIEQCSQIQRDCSDARLEWCAVTTPITEQEMQQAIELFRSIRNRLQELYPARSALATRLDRLNREIGRKADYIRAEATIDQLNGMMRELEQQPFDRFEREVAHRYRVGQDIPTSVGHVRPLEQELRELGGYHPALRYIRGEGDNVIFELPGLAIRVTPTSILVKGDPAILRPHTNAKAAGEEGVSRRFRSIVMSKNSPATEGGGSSDSSEKIDRDNPEDPAYDGESSDG